MDSILTSVKKLLGIAEDYVHFDSDLIMDINAVFMILMQLGVGPEEGFSISDKTAIWSDFLPDGPIQNLVKDYVHQKVRLMFDTSTLTSAMIDVINHQIAEDEWRLNVEVENSRE